MIFFQTEDDFVSLYLWIKSQFFPTEHDFVSIHLGINSQYSYVNSVQTSVYLSKGLKGFNRESSLLRQGFYAIYGNCQDYKILTLYMLNFIE